MSLAQEIADELIGTCKEIHDVAERHEVDNWELMAALDEYAMQCKRCGWWDATEDMDTTGDEPECSECCGGA